MTYRFRPACTTLRRDPGHLRLSDRAVLRILNRSEVATAAQLTVLAYGHRHVAQARLRQLWQLGYLDRATLPPIGPRGGAPYAYRLSSACLHRLGYRRTPWRGPGYLAHTLDAVEAVCSLIATSDPETEPLVQLWLPESIVADALPNSPVPDTIVVLDAGSGSGVVCLEIDESTQHVAPIRDKLRAYRRAIGGRPGWHVLFVVPSSARRGWLRRIARGCDLGGLSLFVVTADDLHHRGPAAELASAAGPARTLPLWTLLSDGRPRRSATPVATRAWLELLGSGGGEERGELLC
jgi:Replication-relaxation